MNNIALSKIKECLSLASEFVKDENSYYSGGTWGGICSMPDNTKQVIKKKSDDIRAEAEQQASRLERQEKCAKLIIECLEYFKAMKKFENTVEKCGCQNK